LPGIDSLESFEVGFSRYRPVCVPANAIRRVQVLATGRFNTQCVRPTGIDTLSILNAVSNWQANFMGCERAKSFSPLYSPHNEQFGNRPAFSASPSNACAEDCGGS